MGDSYENIEHPDVHQFGDSREKMIDRMAADLKYLERKYDRVCADLNSIIDRCQEGKIVYVKMPDGELLFLKKDPDGKL